jgi:paraquat-inducible protein B
MSNLSKTDHGQVVTVHRRGIAWVWIFPALAALATTWLFFAQWASQGPEIEIVFDEAPGIEPGKTSLYYRGVNSGTVQAVRIQDDLQTVAVKVRLEGFASNLATEETKYWIDRPVISLTELTGLESIVRGNSLQAGTPGGKSQYQFIGRPKPPIIAPDSQTFSFWLDGAQISFLARGTPVYHRGVKVGVVSQKILSPDGRASLQVSVEAAYRDSISANSRFWSVPWTSVTLGAGGLSSESTFGNTPPAKAAFQSPAVCQRSSIGKRSARSRQRRKTSEYRPTRSTRPVNGCQGSPIVRSFVFGGVSPVITFTKVAANA